MREKWQDLFLEGLEAEKDIFRLGEIFKENVARQTAANNHRTGRGADLPVAAAAARPTNAVEPTQLPDVAVTARRPDWLRRQMSRARSGLEDFLNGRPSSGEAYYGLPAVQPRTPQERAEQAQFIRQRESFHALVKSRDHLQRNIDAARRDPWKYTGDVALGALKGAGQEGLGLANSALAAYAFQHPETAVGAYAINGLTGKRAFEVTWVPWGRPTVQISQPEGLRPRGDIQNQWSYLGRFGGLVGTGAAAEAMLPARVVAPAYRPLRRPSTPNGQYYSVAYEAKLKPIDWGRRHEVHVNRASAQLDDALLSDQAWAAGMEEIIPGLRQAVSNIGGRNKPVDWMWHHDGVARPARDGTNEYGFVQLTPEDQHLKGSIFWDTFHPDARGRGGYAIWAVPAGAPPRR